jgi:hypothetical protein
MVSGLGPRMPFSDEDFSWWGVFGFMLLPAGLFLGVLQSCKGNRLAGLFLLCGALFILGQSYIGPYDPWRGRYLSFLAIFWTPFISLLFHPNEKKNYIARSYIMIIILIGCLSAILAVVLRDFRPITLGFKTSRIEQLTIKHKAELLGTFMNFEKIVPSDAVVVLCLPPGTLEYPLFGKGLTRTLIPVRTPGKYKSMFPEPDYLLYRIEDKSPLFLCPPSENDLYLGGRYFLRKLKK